MGAGLRPGAKATDKPPDPTTGAPVLDSTVGQWAYVGRSTPTPIDEPAFLASGARRERSDRRREGYPPAGSRPLQRARQGSPVAKRRAQPRRMHPRARIHHRQQRLHHRHRQRHQRMQGHHHHRRHLDRHRRQDQWRHRRRRKLHLMVMPGDTVMSNVVRMMNGEVRDALRRKGGGAAALVAQRCDRKTGRGPHRRCGPRRMRCA